MSQHGSHKYPGTLASPQQTEGAGPSPPLISCLWCLNLSGHRKAPPMTLAAEKLHFVLSLETREILWIHHHWAGPSWGSWRLSSPPWFRAEQKCTQRSLELGPSLDVPSSSSVVAARSERGPERPTFLFLRTGPGPWEVAATVMKR